MARGAAVVSSAHDSTWPVQNMNGGWALSLSDLCRILRRGARRDDHAAVAQGRESNGQAVHGLTQA